jgi:hypothetical protein
VVLLGPRLELVGPLRVGLREELPGNLAAGLRLRASFLGSLVAARIGALSNRAISSPRAAEPPTPDMPLF